MENHFFENKQKNSGDLKEPYSWRGLFRVAVMIFATFSCCTLFFFLIFRFEGFTDGWNKIVSSAQPIIIGMLLAYIMNPIMRFLDRHVRPLVKKAVKSDKKAEKISRGIGITGTTIGLILLIVLAIWAIVPALVSSCLRLLRMLPTYVNSTMDILNNTDFGDSEIAEYLSSLATQGVDYIEKWATQTLLPQAQTYITHITTGVIRTVSFLMDFIIGIIVMIYVMAIQDKLGSQAKKVIYAFLPPRVGNMTVEIIRKGDEIFGGFLTGKIIDSAIIGAIAWVGCSLMRTPDTILVACLIGVTNIIPFFGPYIGAVPSILLVLIQSPWHALYLLIFIIILQQIDGNIIGPKILGSSTGLSSFWVMVAILISGGMFGLTGMILGVPVFGLLYYLARRLINYEVRKKNLPVSSEQYKNLDHIDIISGNIIPKSENRKSHKDKPGKE